MDLLLRDLAEQKIVLSAEDDRLKVNAPKGAMTAELAARIKANKTELMRFLAESKQTEQPITRVPRDQDLPLSFAQQRLWFLDQLEAGGAAYNVPFVHHLSGDVNVDALKDALREIVRRHEVLRTSFALRDNGPVQVVHEDFELPVAIIDCQADFAGNDDFPALAEEHRGKHRVMAMIREEALTPFDLSSGHMWRVQCFLLSPRSLVLMVTMHHIVADGWSVEIIGAELAALYGAFAAGKPSPLQPLPIQYADFSVWQRQWLEGERLRQQQAYWADRLQGLPPLLELPTDHPRPAVQGFEGAWELVTLSNTLVDRLEALGKREGATLFMTLMALFDVLMARLSGQEDIAVGSPIANRERIELEGLIGYFANTFVLRTQVPAGDSFRQILERVCRDTREAYIHQDVPFEHLVDQLVTERSLSHSPLFQVMFTLRESIQSGQDTGMGLQTTKIHPGWNTSKFDLTLNLTRTPGGAEGFMEYSTVLFEARTICRWFAYYLALAESVLAEPDRAVGALPMMPESERQEILVDWNRTDKVYPGAAGIGAAGIGAASIGAAGLGAGCIHEHFEAQAARTPDQVAVIYDAMEGEPGNKVARLTFQELDQRANQLAHALRERGVGPDICVGLCLERSPDMVVGMLAILKAGGAYVPLDPAYPADRLAYMLEDAAIELMITSPQLAQGFPDSVTPLFITDELLQAYPHTRITSGVTPDNLLYVIYTSGSTGRPKGIALSHEALVNLILWHLDDLTEPGAVLQFASMSFDASYHEIFAAWNAGNALLLVPEEMRYDFTQLPRLLAHHQVRKTILPVVVLQQWAESYPEGTPLLQGLCDVITTGEQLQVTPPVIRLFGTLPHARLHNHYGPAETHVVTAYSFDTDHENWPYHAPVGYPVANTQIHILDDYFQPAPEGVKGHLFIGGTNLGRCYLNRAGMTAEKFVPNPFGRGGSRLYKTGDLARYLAGGNIEFLGRADHMIKLRGFRVEPAEVEAVLTADERVNRAIVLVRGDAAHEKRLVAYVVTEGQQANAAETLRGVVARQLPEYMVPSAVVVMDDLPLSPTGKVDRKALPDPDFTAMSEEAVVPPRDETETTILNIWAHILRLDGDKIGVHHNFFNLGGHSLSATRVISRVRQDFQLDLPLRELFVSPTVAGLAEEVRNRLWLQGGSEAGDEEDVFEEAI